MQLDGSSVCVCGIQSNRLVHWLPRTFKVPIFYICTYIYTLLCLLISVNGYLQYITAYVEYTVNKAIQWNLSIENTIGAQLAVLYREVSLIQR